MPKSRMRKHPPKHVLALSDLEQAKAAVLNSLTSRRGRRTYDRAITDFVDWYCSEPGLSFNRSAVFAGDYLGADLPGKASHIRTVPIPNWVKVLLDQAGAAATRPKRFGSKMLPDRFAKPQTTFGKHGEP